MNSIKCNRCKVELPETDFEKNRSGNFYKQCNQCRKYAREYGKKNKCIHDKRKDYCKECGGSQICEHKVNKRTCRYCKGAGICEHNKQKSRCRKCGGSQICEHDKRKDSCSQCGGKLFCEHRKRKADCGICSPLGHIIKLVRTRVYTSLKSDKSKHSIEYLGCPIDEFKEHIEKQFIDGMTWDNHGSVWHIDHIIPLKYENPTIEEVYERLHYTNTQPLLASENMSKGNRFIG